MSMHTPTSLVPGDPGDRPQGKEEDLGGNPATQALSVIGGGFSTAVDAGMGRVSSLDAATTTRPMAIPIGLVSPAAQTTSIPVFRATESVRAVSDAVHGSGPVPRPASSVADARAADTRLRPASAPVPLRVGVLLLLTVFLLSLAGVVLGHVRPAWLPHRFSATATVDHPLLQASSRSTASRMTLLTSSSSGQTYWVSAPAYSIVVTADHPCWVQVMSGLRSTPVFAETIQPGTSPVAIPVRGNSSAVVAAQTQSIAVVVAGHTLGTISSPKVGLTYRFTVIAPRNSGLGGTSK